MSSYVEVPGTASDQSVITRTAAVQVPAGSRVARIPVGNFFYGKQDAQQTECLVTLNGIPQDWGADFAWYYIGRKIRNPLSSPRAVVCSELVMALDPGGVRFPEWLDYDSETTTPEDLLEDCKRSVHHFRKVG